MTQASPFGIFSCNVLTIVHPDHTPLLLTFQRGEKPGPASFRFQKMWLEHNDYEQLVSTTWNQSIAGCPMFVLGSKLRLSKQAFRSWNKCCFGNVHDNVKACQDVVNVVQRDIDTSVYSDELKDRESQAQIDLEKLYPCRGNFLEEKGKY